MKKKMMFVLCMALTLCSVSGVRQAFDGMEAQDRRGVVDSLQKYFRKLQRDIQREISPQERKQPEQDRPVR